MEVSGLLGQMPSRLGYQPTMSTELSGLEERIANTHAGAITSIQAVYVPADDLTDPAAVACVFASLRLDRALAQAGERRPLSGHRPAPIQLENGDARHSRRPALQTGAGNPQDPGAVRGPQGYRRDARPGAAFPGRPQNRRSRPAAGALSDAAVFHHRAVQRDQGEARQPQGLARWLRTHSAGRVQGLSGERALHDRSDRRGEKRGPPPKAQRPPAESAAHES